MAITLPRNRTTTQSGFLSCDIRSVLKTSEPYTTNSASITSIVRKCKGRIILSTGDIVDCPPPVPSDRIITKAVQMKSTMYAMGQEVKTASAIAFPLLIDVLLSQDQVSYLLNY